MMEIKQGVIEDLWPLYAAGEASADTRTLVEEYLENNPDFSQMAKESAMLELPHDIPVSLTKEDKMEAYKEAKRLMFVRTIVLAAIISSSLIVVFLVSLLAFRVM